MMTRPTFYSGAVAVATALFGAGTHSVRQGQGPAPKPPAPSPAPAQTAPAKPAEAAGKMPDKLVLVYKAKTGQIARYVTSANLKVAAGGQTGSLDMKESERVTFTGVSPSGDITMERETESSETTFNGQKAPDDENDNSKSTMVVHANGTLVSYKSEKDEPAQDKLQVRMYPATTPIFTDKAVGIGDKWSWDFKADQPAGARAAHADYEVLGYEKVLGIDTVKLKMIFKESEGQHPLGSTGTFWIEPSSGDTVEQDLDIENMTFGEGAEAAMANGKIHQERTSGSPLPGGKPFDPTVKSVEKNIDETVKDYKKLPGAVTLYRKKEAGRDTIYMEVKESQLDKPMLLEVTASTGMGTQAMVAGDPINDLLIEFQRKDDRIFLVTPNINFRAKPNTPIARTLQRSFADGYLEVYKIEAKQADRKSLLINVSELFRGDVARIAEHLPGFSMDREKTYIDNIKNFPDNLVVQTDYHFSGGRGGSGGLLSALLGSDSSTLADPHSLPLKVNYNLFFLPPTNAEDKAAYRPRFADPRVGYFTVDYQDFNDDSRDDQTNRYILRWDLRKANPSAPMSAPVKPIVFWLDNAIPTEYRGPVTAGILEWNKAFEKLGIQDAIVVKQMPDNADWDHADMRYNVIRWVASPDNGYAVSLFRVNPLTGQILNADITVDENLVRGTKLEQKILVDPSSFFKEAAVGQKLDPATLNDPKKLLMQCDMAREAVEQEWFGFKALSLLAPPGVELNDKPYIQEFLRMVVSHEMGHILGLRHNFLGSTYHSMDELKNGKTVAGTGVSASVMDYIPFNIAALKTSGVDYFQQTIGPYDIWAIQYGYSPIQATTSEGEVPALKRIASRCNEPGLGYQSDEIADTFDPDVTRFDLGRDPLAYWDRMLQVSRYLMFNLDKREPKKGESYLQFTKDFERLLNVYARAAAETSRYVGALHANRNFRGDPGEKPVLATVDEADQKRALGLLNTYVFSETAFNLPKGDYSKLQSDPYSFDIMAMLTGDAQSTFPMRDTLSSIQQSALRRVFSGPVLRRVANNEFKAADPSKALRLADLFSSVSDSVWSEAEGHHSVCALRRQLQRSHLDMLITMFVSPASGTPDDAKMLAWDQLRKLRTRLHAARTDHLDDYTRIHYDEALMRIDRALDAKVMIGGGTPSRSISLQSLLGAEGDGATQKP